MGPATDEELEAVVVGFVPAVEDAVAPMREKNSVNVVKTGISTVVVAVFEAVVAAVVAIFDEVATVAIVCGGIMIQG